MAPLGIAVDEIDQLYLSGQARENTTGFYATPNCHQPEKAGGFLTKINPNGQRIWSTYYGDESNYTNIYDLQIIRKKIYIVPTNPA